RVARAARAPGSATGAGRAGVAVLGRRPGLRPDRAAAAGTAAGTTVGRGRAADAARLGLAPARTARAGRDGRLLRGVVAGRVTGVDLARAPDPELRILLLLQPVRDPAGGAGDGEHHREHLGRDAQRLVDDAGIEVDVRIQLALHEVVVLQRRLFQAHRDLEHRVVDAQLLEYLVAHLADDLGARVEVLVDAVAEAHQAEARILVLGPVDRRLH